MNTSKLLLVSTVSLLVATLALADSKIYKWKDKTGVVHFTQELPKDIEYEIITTKTRKTAEATDPSKVNADGTEVDAGKNSEVKKNARICEQATKNLELLQNNPVIQDANGKIMTLDEINKKIEENMAIQSIHC